MASTDPKKVSPKVIVGLLTGLAIAAIGGILAAVTPDTFAFLGAWGPLVYSVVTVGGAQLAAYLKRDPARVDTAAVLDAAVLPQSGGFGNNDEVTPSV